MKRPCLDCRKPTDKRRCVECQRKYEVQRGPRTMKGHYDAEWVRLSKRAIKEHPWCVVCNHPGSPDNPLTGDHIIPHGRGGRNVRSNVQVLCLRHNSSKGARLDSGGA